MRPACGPGQLVIVVEDQDDGIAIVQSPQQPGQDSARKIGSGCNEVAVDIVIDLHAGAAQGRDDASHQPDGVSVAVGQGQPCRPGRAPARPGRQQGGLAEPGRCGQERQWARRGRIEDVQQPLADDVFRSIGVRCSFVPRTICRSPPVSEAVGWTVNVGDNPRRQFRELPRKYASPVSRAKADVPSSLPRDQCPACRGRSPGFAAMGRAVATGAAMATTRSCSWPTRTDDDQA